MASLLKSHQPTAKPLHIAAALHETTNRSGFSAPNATFGFGKFDAYMARSRMVNAQHTAIAYSLTSINAGNFFSNETYEATGDYTVNDCQSSPTNTAIYELKSPSSSFFSISEAELRYASIRGYSPVRFAYACLRQPHDTTDTVRNIDIFREFRNISRKR